MKQACTKPELIHLQHLLSTCIYAYTDTHREICTLRCMHTRTRIPAVVRKCIHIEIQYPGRNFPVNNFNNSLIFLQRLSNESFIQRLEIHVQAQVPVTLVLASCTEDALLRRKKNIYCIKKSKGFGACIYWCIAYDASTQKIRVDVQTQMTVTFVLTL